MAEDYKERKVDMLYYPILYYAGHQGAFSLFGSYSTREAAEERLEEADIELLEEEEGEWAREQSFGGPGGQFPAGGASVLSSAEMYERVVDGAIDESELEELRDDLEEDRGGMLVHALATELGLRLPSLSADQTADLLVLGMEDRGEEACQRIRELAVETVASEAKLGKHLRDTEEGGEIGERLMTEHLIAERDEDQG